MARSLSVGCFRPPREALPCSAAGGLAQHVQPSSPLPGGTDLGEPGAHRRRGAVQRYPAEIVEELRRRGLRPAGVPSGDGRPALCTARRHQSDGEASRLGARRRPLEPLVFGKSRQRGDHLVRQKAQGGVDSTAGRVSAPELRSSSEAKVDVGAETSRRPGLVPGILQHLVRGRSADGVAPAVSPARVPAARVPAAAGRAVAAVPAQDVRPAPHGTGRRSPQGPSPRPFSAPRPRPAGPPARHRPLGARGRLGHAHRRLRCGGAGPGARVRLSSAADLFFGFRSPAAVGSGPGGPQRVRGGG